MISRIHYPFGPAHGSPTRAAGRCSQLAAVFAALLVALVAIGSHALAQGARDICADPCCLIDALPLNTGYNHLTGALYGDGRNDDFWTIVSDANDTKVPRAAFAVPTKETWDQPGPNSGWVSTTHDGTDRNGNVVYKKCFCVCSATPSLMSFSLNVNTPSSGVVRVDGVDMVVIGPGNNLLSFTRSLSTGVHCVEFAIGDDISIGSRLNVQGSVQGKGLVKYECCDPTVIAPQDECQTNHLKIGSSNSWNLISGPGNGTYPRCAVTVTAPPAAWGTPISGTSWIGTAVNGLPTGAGVYVYRKCFCVDKDGTYSITISTMADNKVDVSLNGLGLFSHTGFQTPPGPSTHTFFVALTVGCNCVDFAVTNNESYTGLDASIDIQGGMMKTEQCCDCGACTPGPAGDLGDGGIDPPNGKTRLGDQGGNEGLSGVHGNAADVAMRPMLVSIPNPTTGETTVQYAIDENADTHVELFNTAGERVMVIDQGLRERGAHALPVITKGLPVGSYRLQLTYGKHKLSIPLNVQ